MRWLFFRVLGVLVLVNVLSISEANAQTFMPPFGDENRTSVFEDGQEQFLLSIQGEHRGRRADLRASPEEDRESLKKFCLGLDLAIAVFKQEMVQQCNEHGWWSWICLRRHAELLVLEETRYQLCSTVPGGS